MTKLEKVKKLMAKYGLTTDDLLELEEDEAVEPKEEKVEELTEEPKKEEKSEVKEEVKEEPKEEKVEEIKEEPKQTNYDELIADLRKENASLRETMTAQSSKLDKVYEILAAQGQVEEKSEESEYAKKLGGTCESNFAKPVESSSYADLLNGKK